MAPRAELSSKKKTKARPSNIIRLEIKIVVMFMNNVLQIRLPGNSEPDFPYDSFNPSTSTGLFWI